MRVFNLKAMRRESFRRGSMRSTMLRHKVKPGITGWAQVNGWRGETDTVEKMQKRVESPGKISVQFIK